MEKTANALANESSPYLLQHAFNPVRWLPWGDEALNKAKAENKLVIISIGYSACHWCHVMERESFEDPEIAQIMNEFFVSVKVDREERPDVDQIYMEAVQAMNNGQGGWPLNCIALPDGRPVYGGTYYPKENWARLLLNLAEKWKKDPAQTEDFAGKVTDFLRNYDAVARNEDAEEYTVEHLARIYIPWSQHFDIEEGGTQRVPKFPLPANWRFLMRYARFSNDPRARKAVLLTLDKLAEGGIFDQAGGGFARYSTDKYWLVPHFEKMLYDNAQLVSLYSEAFQFTLDESYRATVEQTLDFIAREMTSPEGGFYSALDADSEGEEGKFYVWTANEIDELLGEDAELVKAYYNISAEGNWERGVNILHRKGNPAEIAQTFGLSEQELSGKINNANRVLLEARSARVRPGLDDKILTSWNGMMCAAYAFAYRVFNKPEYLAAAEKNMAFLLENQHDNGRLNRNYKEGKSTINAYLDDYAFVLDALVELYQATFKEEYLKIAEKITEYAIAHFLDESNSMFFYTSDIDPPLIARKKEITDNVIPASNSAMAHALLSLGKYLDNARYSALARQMLDNIAEDVQKHGSMYAHWGALMMRFVYPDAEVALSGSEAETFRNRLDRFYFPHRLYAGTKTGSDLPLLKDRQPEETTRIFVCREKTCQLPVEKPEEAIRQLTAML